jgi:transposase-like protein
MYYKQMPDCQHIHLTLSQVQPEATATQFYVCHDCGEMFTTKLERYEIQVIRGRGKILPEVHPDS